MALAVLAPWPAQTAAVALAAARACLKAALGATGLDDARLDALGATAAAMVERYAPGAPQPVKNEAVLRLCGWLKGSPAGDLAPTGAGTLTFSWRPGASRNALRNSGAMGLLSGWHRPRAMILEDTS